MPISAVHELENFINGNTVLRRLRLDVSASHLDEPNFSASLGSALANSNVRVLSLHVIIADDEMIHFARAFGKLKELYISWNQISNVGAHFLFSNIGFLDILDITGNHIDRLLCIVAGK